MKHVSPISGIAVNNNFIATAGYDNKVILWNRITFDPISVGYHDHLVNQCEFSACGNFIVSSSSDYSARLWRIPDMRLIKIFNTHNDDVEFATFDKKVMRIATASRDNTITVSNIYDDEIKILRGHKNDVLSVYFEDEKLISCSDDGTVRQWDIETECNVILSESSFQTDTIAINGSIIFSGDDAGTIYIINGMNINKIKAHDSGVKRLHFFNEKQLLISMAYDRQCILWKYNMHNLEELDRFDLPNIVWPRSCAMYDNLIYFTTFGSSFGVYDVINQSWMLQHVMSTNGINAINLYNKEVYKIGDSGQLKIGEKIIYSTSSLSNFIIQFLNKIVVGGQNGQLINTTDGKIIFQYKSPLNCATSFKDRLYIGTYTGEILIFYNFNNNPIVVKLHNNAIKDIIIINQYVITVCANGEICRYHILFEQKIIVQAHNNIINSCSKLNDNTFVTVSRDKKMKLWDIKTLDCIQEIDTPHTHSIKAVATSSNAQFIASGSYNGLICILNQISHQWFKKRVTNKGISCIEYDKNNNQFVASSYDGNLYFLPIREIFNEY